MNRRVSICHSTKDEFRHVPASKSVCLVGCLVPMSMVGRLYVLRTQLKMKQKDILLAGIEHEVTRLEKLCKKNKAKMVKPDNGEDCI